MSESLGAEWRRSLAEPEAWWGERAGLLTWVERPRCVFTPGRPFGRWFEDGVLNLCANCLDRHVAAGRGEQVALIWDSPLSGNVTRLTYRALLGRVAKFAGALAAAGVGRGDRVVIYMPMVPEAVVAMLACARLGAVHSVVFGGFAAPELAARIDDATPRAIVASSCGLEPGRVVPYAALLEEALRLASHRPAACFMLQREPAPAPLVPGRDIDFLEAERKAVAHAPVPVPAADPLYILYTSGTTGRPKGIVRDAGGYGVALAWSMEAIYQTRPGEVFWTSSDIGWTVGHSYLLYGPLLTGCTTVIYEGKPVGTPDAGAFWRVCAAHDVRAFFTAPTALRAIKQQDPDGVLLRRYDLSRLRALYVAGERCDPPTQRWAAALLGKPVIDNWWQTETGWPVTASFPGLGFVADKPGSAGRPSPGYDLRVLDDDGHVLASGEAGNLAIRLPLPPGCAPSLWGDDAGYARAYLEAFPGYYRTGDAGVIDAEGDVFVLGRTDDVINVAGHRLSTGEMEEVLGGHEAVAECAVIAVPDAVKGEVPLALVVRKAGAAREGVEEALVRRIRERIGPVAAMRRVVVVSRLPKTRSGKILRGTMRRIAAGESPPVPATIEDPAVLEDVAAILGPAEGDAISHESPLV